MMRPYEKPKNKNPEDILMSQYVRNFSSKTTTGIQSKPDASDESSTALTLLTMLGVEELKHYFLTENNSTIIFA